MMAFDPDQYLAGASGGFDPDAYLGAKPDNAGTMANIGLGALRGASNIGRTLMMPVDYAGDVLSGNKGSSIDARKAALDDFFKSYADPESIAFKGGELATEIAGTAGVGSGLAVGAKAAGMSPAMVAALESGGLSLGNAVATTGREMMKNAATRVGAGALVGGASAGVINPSAGDVATGAAIGGALPVAVRAGGELGKMAKAAIYDPIANKDKIIGGLLSRTVGQNAPVNLQMPATPGVRFSASESTGNQGLAALEDTLRAVNPSGSLAAQSQSNRTALADTMRGMAKDESAIKAAETARSAATSPMYSAARASDVPVDASPVVGLIDGLISKNPANQALVSPLKKIKNSLYESRGTPARLVATDRAGNPVNIPLPDQPPLRNFLDEVRKAGGIASSELSDIGADISNKSYPGLFRKNGGMTMDRLAEFADQMGWMVSGQIDDLERNAVGGSHEYVRDMIRGALNKDEIIHPGDWDAYANFNGLVDDIKNAGFNVAKIPGTPEKLRSRNNELMSAVDNVKAMLGDQKNAFVRRELMTVKRALEHEMAMASPAFKKAEKAFAAMSKPINQMQVAQNLTDKLLPATSGAAPAGMNAATLARAMQNRDQVARTATGFRRARYDKIMEPDQSQAISGVVDDSKRIAEMMRLGAGFGSPTARRQSLKDLVTEHISDQAPAVSALMRGLGSVPAIGLVPRGIQAVGRGVTNMVSKNSNDQMLAMLEEALANNPGQVANYLAAYGAAAPGRLGSLIDDPRIIAAMRTAPIAISAGP